MNVRQVPRTRCADPGRRVALPGTPVSKPDPTAAANNRHRFRQGMFRTRIAFTLTELLVVIAIIGLLASSVLFAMWGAMEMAREARTRTQIAKLNELLMTRWDSYRTRAIRLKLTPAQRRNREDASRLRLNALRDLMRMEMPDRITDIAGPVAPGLSTPSLLIEYRRRIRIATKPANVPLSNWSLADALDAWTPQHQGAECLYMIIASIRSIEGNGLDFLHEGEIGDVDTDGMPEILDAWGNPIEFIRWPAGFLDEWVLAQTGQAYAISDIMSAESPDPFDPLHLDFDVQSLNGFALYPLVFSAGPDELYDINSPTDLDYTDPEPPNPPNNPYYEYPDPDHPTIIRRVGEPMDANEDGILSYFDNIHNHASGGR